MSIVKHHLFCYFDVNYEVCMIDFLASKITENLVKSSIINEKIPVYRYGIELLISSAIGISLILTLGVISNTFLEATVFLLLFIILRQQTGGYHSNTYVGCNTSFSIIYLILVYIIKHRPIVVPGSHRIIDE